MWGSEAGLAKRHTDAEPVHPESSGWAPPPPEMTTLIIKNLPCKVDTEMLAEIVEALGFGGKYDFLYVVSARFKCTPKDKYNANLGYAFANFRTSADAQTFADTFEGYEFSFSNSAKRGSTERARIQGYSKCIAQIRRSSMHTESADSVMDVVPVNDSWRTEKKQLRGEIPSLGQRTYSKTLSPEVSPDAAGCTLGLSGGSFLPTVGVVAHGAVGA
eukprot:CAMPEP_0113831502 /NCGR_PEP_ID=MMETSP0328-20130328/6890_1 /TAXON_ID=39455 /ORGANISM="Alexandrium minutum" /LENGTH=215 /DNA_ID=CAMNT_0000799673 /DNA_START=117 /DNA_END=761 /DNA_ORIENTATION=- /assembly_acc=CAM_ASM_000350